MPAIFRLTRNRKTGVMNQKSLEARPSSFNILYNIWDIRPINRINSPSNHWPSLEKNKTKHAFADPRRLTSGWTQKIKWEKFDRPLSNQAYGAPPPSLSSDQPPRRMELPSNNSTYTTIRTYLISEYWHFSFHLKGSNGTLGTKIYIKSF